MIEDLTSKVKQYWLPFLFGLVSLTWYLLRTGMKPSRDTYPCQQAAKANTVIWLMAYIAPVLTAPKVGWRRFTLSRAKLTLVLVCLAVGSIVIYSIVATGWWGQKTDGTDSKSELDGVKFPLLSHDTYTTISSKVFAVNGTAGNDGGLITLLNLMGTQGLLFYASNTTGSRQGPDGLIARGDVIIIKVNSQWAQRGGTNTDLLKAVIQTIVTHPDGWHGEIIVADNGQAQYGSAGIGGSLDWQESNAEDHSQSVQDVVDGFPEAYRVSTYLWDTITTTRVQEYSEGDDLDGYIVNATRNIHTGLIVSYPKFTTKFGTRISFKHGVWDADRGKYDSGCLKVLNLPVLKTHSGYGVTASVKHYMGVASDKLTKDLGSRTHNAIRQGGMGTQMLETRFPTINILDAIWVNCSPLAGPSSSYGQATRLNVVAASTDPIALDAWAARHILQEAYRKKTGDTSATMDPDNDQTSSFGSWLRLSMEEMLRAGRLVNIDEKKINVYVTEHR